jgi:hypothetical protein
MGEPVVLLVLGEDSSVNFCMASATVRWKSSSPSLSALFLVLRLLLFACCPRTAAPLSAHSGAAAAAAESAWHGQLRTPVECSAASVWPSAAYSVRLLPRRPKGAAGAALPAAALLPAAGAGTC